jgi:hypothetical protein
VKVDIGGKGVVSHVGLHALGSFADRLGLGDALSSAIPQRPTLLHDRGKVLVEAALVLAGGGESCADIEHLRAEAALFGFVASDSTLHRSFHEINEKTRAKIATKVASVRAKVWERSAVTKSGPVFLDIDASLVEIHSDQVHGAHLLLLTELSAQQALPPRLTSSELDTVRSMSERFGEERDLSMLVVPRVGTVRTTEDLWEPVRLIDSAGDVVPSVAAFLKELQASGRSTSTQRSYAMDLLRWFRFAWAVEVPWDQATRLEARDFCRWLALREKPARPTGGVRSASSLPNPVTGKPGPGRKYAVATRSTACPRSRNGASSSATSNDARSPSALAAAHMPLRASTNTPACAARCYGPTLPSALG